MNAIRILAKYVLKTDFTGFGQFEKYAHVMLGVMIFLVLYRLFRNAKRNIVVELSDKYSYYVYLVHHIFILGPFTILGFLVEPFSWMVALICIIASTYILYNLTKRIRI